MDENQTDLELPFSKSWWIDPGRVFGGRFPGTPSARETDETLSRLLDVGVRTLINLQAKDELGANGKPFPDYTPALERLTAARGVDVRVHRFPIPDMGVPQRSLMARILDTIDGAVEAGHRVYVHCWGGHGRTGTVAGCWLVWRGIDFEQAMKSIERSRQHDPHLTRFPAPQTNAQRQFVRGWLSRNVQG